MQKILLAMAIAFTSVGALAAQDSLVALKSMADHGDVEAQYDLGAKYAAGIDVRQDAFEAVRWYRQAAELGHTKAQFHLGMMYAQGKGVAQNDMLAHMWASLAASSGVPEARQVLDLVEGRMTPQQITTAKDKAASCQAHNFKDC